LSEKSDLELKEYFEGASISVGFVLLSITILANIYPYINSSDLGIQEPVFLILYIAIHLVGGSLGGYLIGIRNIRKTIWHAVHTSALTYIIESISFFLLRWSIAGDLWALISLMVGGVIGGIFAKRKQLLNKMGNLG
jgi:uncharacterized protein YneF (UPF0154 family)